MEPIQFKILCETVKEVLPKAPLTYIADNTMLFRGERLEVIGSAGRTRRYEFRFSSTDSFIEGLRTYGLMVNYKEFQQIINLYTNRINGNGNGNIKKYDK